MKAKALFAAILVIAITMFFCGCSYRTPSGIVSIYTSEGFTGTYDAFNGSRWNNPTAKAASAPAQIKLSEGETAHIEFFCTECKYAASFDEVSPYSGVLSCECSENTNYFAIQLFAKYMNEE